MKKLLLPLILLFSLSSFAQVAKRNILENKYTQEQVKKSLIAKDAFLPYPQTPNAWRAAVPADVLASLIKNGEEALDYHFQPISATISLDYVRSGDRLRHSGISFTKRNKLMNLVIAESIENEGRFVEAILNGVWSICEESYWGVPAHISSTGLPDVDDPVVDLFAAETAGVLALADYFTGEKLDTINTLIRKRIYSETNKRVLTPILTHPDRYGWMSKTRPVNNWNPWIMSNWILSSLLLEKDENRRAQMVYGAMVGLDSYLNSLGEDGGCDEGPSYWFAAGASVYDCLELLQEATRNTVNIYDHPLIRKMATYVYKTHIDGDYFVNFADADPKLRPDGLMLYRFGQAIQDANMQEFGKWAYQTFPNHTTDGFMRMRRVENLLTIQKMDQTSSKYKPVQDAWFEDIQVLTARTDKGLFLATHGGHNAESHNHNDVGDFMIYLNGQPMIVDAGRGNYTARTFSSQRYELWFTRSDYHNVPLVNGIDQKAGRQYEATQVESTVNEKEASLRMNIAGAYPPEAGIEQWERLVKLDRQNNQVEILDNYVLKDKPSSLQQIFMTICEIDTSQPGKILFKGDQNTWLTLLYDAKDWTVSTDLPSTEGMEYESFKTKWDNHPVRRIILTRNKPKEKGKYSFSFAADGK